MKFFLFAFVANLLLNSSPSYAGPIDLFVRAEAVKGGIALDQPHFKVGDVIIEKGKDGDWQSTFVSKVISLDKNEVSFLESRVDSGVQVIKNTFTMNLATGEIARLNDQPSTKLSDWEIQVKNIEKKTLSTVFGEKKCSILTIELHKISNNYLQKDVVYTFCDSIPGSGVLYNSWNVLSEGRELKDYLD